MEKDLEVIVDECIDLINRGMSVEECISAYPEYSDKLEPMLRSVVDTQSAIVYKPSASAQRAGRLKLYAALDRKKKPSFWHRIFANKAVVAAAVCVLIVVLAAYFGLSLLDGTGDPNGSVVEPPATGYPTQTVTSTSSSPSSTTATEEPAPSESPSATETAAPADTEPATPEETTDPESETPVYYVSASCDGNFVFLVSDDVNAIEDFENVYVTIESVRTLKSGKDAGWIGFEPETKTFDLAALPGEVTQELWRGNLPEGSYKQVFIDVSKVNGVLKSTGGNVEIKLPANKLILSVPFEVAPGYTTSFVYDLTVIQKGNGDYQLKPQAGESGASKTPVQD
jgi:hypothetical protein